MISAGWAQRSSEPPILRSIQVESGHPFVQLVGCELDQMTLMSSLNLESLGLIQGFYFNYHSHFLEESSSVKLWADQGLESGKLSPGLEVQVGAV